MTSRKISPASTSLADPRIAPEAWPSVSPIRSSSRPRRCTTSQQDDRRLHSQGPGVAVSCQRRQLAHADNVRLRCRRYSYTPTKSWPSIATTPVSRRKFQRLAIVNATNSSINPACSPPATSPLDLKQVFGYPIHHSPKAPGSRPRLSIRRARFLVRALSFPHRRRRLLLVRHRAHEIVHPGSATASLPSRKAKWVMHHPHCSPANGPPPPLMYAKDYVEK